MHDIPRAKALYQECMANPIASLCTLRHELSNADVLVRHVAAVQLAIHHPKEVPQSIVAELVATLRSVSRVSVRRKPLADDYGEATAGEGDWHDLGQDIALALANLPANLDSSAIVPLVQIWQEDRQFGEAALAAMALAFPIAQLPTSVIPLNPATIGPPCLGG